MTIFVAHFFSNLLRMFVFTKSRPFSILGHVGSKCRSLGQFLEKLMNIPESIFLAQTSANMIRMLVLIEYLTSLKWGHVGSKIRELGHLGLSTL